LAERYRVHRQLRRVVTIQIRLPETQGDEPGPRNVIGVRLVPRIDRDTGESAEAVIETAAPDKIFVDRRAEFVGLHCATPPAGPCVLAALPLITNIFFVTSGSE
jgi:hypothetical protein